MSTIGLTKIEDHDLLLPSDMKISQDILKMISGHVVAKNDMLRMLSLLQYCSREFSWESP